MAVSNHGEKRVKSRIGIPKKSIDRQFKLAKERGLRQNDLNGKLKGWAAKIALKTGKPHDVVLYNSFCFVMGGETLITVIPVPGNLQKDLQTLTKKKNKKLGE